MSYSSESAGYAGDSRSPVTIVTSETPKELHVLHSIPQWFLQNNVKTPDELDGIHLSLSVVESAEHEGDSESAPEQEAGICHWITLDSFSEVILTVAEAFACDDERNLSPADSCVLLKFPLKSSPGLQDAVLLRLAQDIRATLVSVDLEDFQDLAEAIHFDNRNLSTCQPDVSSSKMDGDSEFHLFNHYFTTSEKDNAGDTRANAIMDLLNLIFSRIGHPAPQDSSHDHDKDSAKQDMTSLVMLHIRDARAIMNTEKHRSFFIQLKQTVQTKREAGHYLLLVISTDNDETSNSYTTSSGPVSHLGNNSGLAEIIDAKAHNTVSVNATSAAADKKRMSDISIGVTNARRLRRKLRNGRARRLGEEVLFPHSDWTEIGLDPRLLGRFRWSNKDIQLAEMRIIASHWDKWKFDFALISEILSWSGLKNDEKYDDNKSKDDDEDARLSKEAIEFARYINQNVNDSIEMVAEKISQGVVETPDEAMGVGREVFDSIPEHHQDHAGIASGYKPDMSLLNVEPEMALTLSDLSDEELQNLASLHDDPTNGNQVELYIYCHLLVYQRKGFTESFDEVLLRAEGWVAETTPDHADRARRIQILDMVAAIKMTLDDTSHKGISLGNLGQTGSMDSLNRAIEFVKKSINAMSRDHPWRIPTLRRLGALLFERIKRTRSQEDIDDLSNIFEILRNKLFGKYPNAAISWNISRYAYNIMKKTTHSLSDQTVLIYDMERVYELAKMIRDTKPQNAADGIGWLANLSLSLLGRFEETRSVHYLNYIIEIQSSGVNALTQDDPDYLPLLNSLAVNLSSRFSQTGSTVDINRAIELIDKAVYNAAPNHPCRKDLLKTLTLALASRYERTGSIDDINRAIEVTKAAFDSAPKDSSSEYYHLMLGGLSGLRFEKTGCIDDLNYSIEATDKAIDATTQFRPICMLGLGTLGVSLSHRFQKTRLADDLNRAIEVTQIIIDKTPQNNFERAPWLNFGSLLAMRFDQTGLIEDQTLALSVYLDGWNCRNASPNDRIKLAREAAKILISRENWKDSYQLLKESVELFHKASPRSLQHDDKLHMLQGLAGLACVAAAVALSAGVAPCDALQLLESGRSIISSQILELRRDVDDLKQQHPQLAEEYISLRDLLDAPVANFLSPTAITPDLALAEQRLRVDQKLSELVQRIREQPGFHQFFLPPREEELKAVGEHGPVVVINLTYFRSDAFLLKHGSIRTLNLPDLKWDEAFEQAWAFKRLGVAYIPRLLKWLWDTICEPVLQELGFSNPVTDNSWPHIWWVPTGILGKFPLHAAGNYDGGSANTVLDRVISSYASSVKAIIYGRRRNARAAIGAPSENVLLVAMKETPGLPWNGQLQFIHDEIKILSKLFVSQGLKLITPIPRKNEVIRYLGSSNIFHFAGHGSSDPAKPLQSSLLLEDWKTNPLTVRDLLEHRLQDNPPFLAYLSACSTSTISGVLDEGMHLVSAFQLAGFRHVVGALWEVSDRYCVDVARILYETVENDGMTDLAVARGLHKAIRALRDGHIKMYSRRDATFVSSETKTEDLEHYYWVPYVHFGV